MCYKKRTSRQIIEYNYNDKGMKYSNAAYSIKIRDSNFL